MMSSFLHNRLNSLSPEESLKRAASSRNRVNNLALLPPYEATAILTPHLKEIFVPQHETQQLLEHCFGESRAYSSMKYATEQMFRAKIYAPIKVEPVFPICLTGLAGVGKSKFRDLLINSYPAPEEYYAGGSLSHLISTPVWYIDMLGKQSTLQALDEFLDKKKMRTDQALNLCRKKAYIQGVTLLIVDEIQFTTTGDGNVRLAQILLDLASLGIPMIYMSNYSAIHKLSARHQEERQRIFDKTSIILADSRESKYWTDYLQACLNTGNLQIDMPFSLFSEMTYEYTWGIRRLVISLISAAYLQSRLSQREKINISDLQTAYTSPAYGSNRKDVTDLFGQNINGEVKNRPDLSCPLCIQPARARALAESVERIRLEHTNRSALLSSLSKSERAVLKEIGLPLGPTGPAPAAPTKRPKPATKENLLAGMRAFMNRK